MGRRGPQPMSPEERAMKNSRDRTKPSVLPEAMRRSWAARAEKFERLGSAMIERAARAKLVNTRANGPQLHPKFKAGLELLEAADRLWNRLGRIGPTPAAPPAPNGDGEAPARPSLESYGQQRPDA